MNEREPALPLGEEHELAIAAAREAVQDLSQLEQFDGVAARTMRNYVARIPEMYSEGAVRVTPLTQVEPGVFFKDERQQVTGAFKPRGAFTNCWLALERDPDVREVAACSAGNHAQGVAQFVNWHNDHFGWGLRAHAFMAETASPAKKQSLRLQKAEIYDQNTATLEDARAAAQEFVKNSARPAIEALPYAAPETIAGQGTIATEILLQLWEAGIDTTLQPLVIRVGWGGGGLALGTTDVLKQLINKGYVHPDSYVIAVQEANTDSGIRGLERYDSGVSELGDLFLPGEFSAANDGTAVINPDTANIAAAQIYRNESLLVFDRVTKAEVGRAMIENPGTEPAGALSVASWQNHRLRFAGEPVPIEVCVVSGGNLTDDKLKEYREAHEDAVDHTLYAVGGSALRGYARTETGYRIPDDVIDAYLDQLEEAGMIVLPSSLRRPTPKK